MDFHIELCAFVVETLGVDTIDLTQGKVRDFIIRASFHQHDKLLIENEDYLSDETLQKLSKLKIKATVIDYHYPHCIRENLQAYCVTIGCDMSWCGMPPVGVLEFDSQSKYALMEKDKYATDIFDSLAETCLYNSLKLIGIPPADARGWIVKKSKDKQHFFAPQSVSCYIDEQVSKDSNLQCFDVTQLDSYKLQLQKYNLHTKKITQLGKQGTKHSMEMDETQEPPKKKQRI